jgi:hypothetical protein
LSSLLGRPNLKNIQKEQHYIFEGIIIEVSDPDIFLVVPSPFLQHIQVISIFGRFLSLNLLEQECDHERNGLTELLLIHFVEC